jgi:hypothetical protein
MDFGHRQHFIIYLYFNYGGNTTNLKGNTKLMTWLNGTKYFWLLCHSGTLYCSSQQPVVTLSSSSWWPKLKTIQKQWVEEIITGWPSDAEFELNCTKEQILKEICVMHSKIHWKVYDTNV